ERVSWPGRRPGPRRSSSVVPACPRSELQESQDKVNEQRSVFMRGLRVIGSYIATHPWPFATAVTGATIYAGMTVASTIVLGRVTDHVLVPAFKGGVGGSTVAWGVVAIMAVGIIRAGGIVTRRDFAGTTGSRMRARLA